MGTKCAPTFATLVLGYLEENLYDTTDEKSDNEFRHISKNCGVDS